MALSTSCSWVHRNSERWHTTIYIDVLAYISGIAMLFDDFESDSRGRIFSYQKEAEEM